MGHFFDAFMGPMYSMLTVLEVSVWSVLTSWNFSESGLNLS